MREVAILKKKLNLIYLLQSSYVNNRILFYYLMTRNKCVINCLVI